MAKVLVLYYSMYGHIETMARAVMRVQAKWMAQKLSLSVYRKPCRRNYLKKQAVKRKLHRLQPRKNWPITTPLFLVHLPALATCPVKCVPSSTRRAACGLPAHYTENWRASLVPPVLAAVRNKPSHPLDDPCASRHGDCPHWLRSAGII